MGCASFISMQFCLTQFQYFLAALKNYFVMIEYLSIVHGHAD